MGLVRSGYGRVHAFLAGLSWLPRVLRGAGAAAALLAIAQANQPWMHVTFIHTSDSGTGYDWGWGTFCNSWFIVVLGIAILVGTIRGNWRRRPVQIGLGAAGFWILYFAVPEYSHVSNSVAEFNATVAVDLGPVPPGSGYAVGTGLYLAIAAGIVALAAGVIGTLATERPLPDRTGEPIYHLVEESEFRACVGRGAYHPGSLDRDGFVHCSFRESVLPVANDYFSRPNSPVLLLEILPNAVEADTKYEAAAPLPGAGATHLHTAPLFPHVYGPIELEAIEGIGVLGRSPDGYSWPEEFFPYEVILG